MIQANELRIGNWVTYNPISVDEGTKIEPLKISSIDSEDEFLKLDDGYENLYGFEEIQPIPLSHEILEKCIFNWHQPIIWLDSDYSIDLNFSHEKGQCTNDRDEVWVYFNNAKLCDVQYLHQLQNLIFSLTGEELTFKP